MLSSECELANLCHDINWTHDELVEVAIFHQVCVVHQAVLKASPRLTTQLSIHLQTVAEVTHAHAGKMIDLNTI